MCSLSLVPPEGHKCTEESLLGTSWAREGAISWDSMFMGVALLAAARSKDRKTQNGACIVSDQNRILGVGYNGLPRGCDDGDPVYWADRDDEPFLSKHNYVVHAEINAILNCAMLPVTGSRIYTTQFPCPQCAQAIIQAGITTVVYLREKRHHISANRAVKKMFDAAAVGMVTLQPEVGAWIHLLSDFLLSEKKSPSP